ncbi:MAG TPA: hypothetical protein VKP88_06255 [Candidatus Paceibacterota bacterium]|nr:hypothetical protein [Candidatus Paceibacterota bacterium]
MAESGSFIPKQQPRTAPKVRRRRVYVVSYVIYTFFLCVALTAIGLLVWEWQLNTQLTERQLTLNEQRERFNPSDILRVKEAEARLNTVTTLLDNQPAASKLFAALNSVTLETVQLQNFSITPGARPNTLVVEYQGVTDSYDSVLAQRQVMLANSLLADGEVLNVQYSANEAVATVESDTDDEAQLTDIENPVQFAVSIELPMQAIMFSGELPTAALSLPATSSAPATVGTDGVEPTINPGGTTATTTP